MTNHEIARTAKRTAKAAGYYVREGSYQGTTDDRLGRWYVGRADAGGFRPYGAGFASASAAWIAAADEAEQSAALAQWDGR